MDSPFFMAPGCRASTKKQFTFNHKVHRTGTYIIDLENTKGHIDLGAT